MVHDILELIRPYDIESKKTRLGPQHDGGYVVCEELITYSSGLFTYGVADDIEFEKHYCEKYKKPAYLFDHTINKEPWEDNFMKYTPEGLGFEDRCDDFINHYKTYHPLAKDVLLKIDIEGGEYDYFENTNLEIISNITTGLLLEVHWINNPTITSRFINMMNTLNKYYALVHTHGNNYGSLWEYNGRNIPNVFEFTFVNRKYNLEIHKTNNIYPIPGLDFPNNTANIDLELDFSNQ
jgi:hypothetical protein